MVCFITSSVRYIQTILACCSEDFMSYILLGIDDTRFYSHFYSSHTSFVNSGSLIRFFEPGFLIQSGNDTAYFTGLI